MTVNPNRASERNDLPNQANKEVKFFPNIPRRDTQADGIFGGGYAEKALELTSELGGDFVETGKKYIDSSIDA